jgi:hypothetical protein
MKEAVHRSSEAATVTQTQIVNSHAGRTQAEAVGRSKDTGRAQEQH